MASHIVVVGSNNMDLVTYLKRMPEAGETIEAPAFAMGHGGKGANQAIAAARLGSAVAMVSKVGDDAFAEATLRNFAANGVDTTHVGTVAGQSSGVAPIFVEPNGENRIVIVKGANDHLSPADVEAARATIAAARLVLLQLEVPLETVYRAIEVAREEGVAVVLNPAPAAEALELPRIRDVAFLVPNETELALLTGLPVASEAEVTAAARQLIAAGIRTVVVTRGARGALLVEPDAVQAIPPVAVTPIDTTGAGDAFIGAFAHFHAAGLPTAEALTQAAAYAALSTTARGTQSSYATAAAFETFQRRPLP